MLRQISTLEKKKGRIDHQSLGFFTKKQLCYIVLHSVLLCGHAWMQQKSEI